jgi:hypothetical protein
MKKEEFAEEFDRINELNQKYKNELEERLKNLLILAQLTLGEFFLSKGFIHESSITKFFARTIDYYYDPKTKVGIKLETPFFTFLDNDYNSISISIVYKCKNKFLPGEKRVLFFFRKEEPENVYKRFKKYMGKTEMKKMKDILRRKYPKEMIISDRSEKINNINNQNK